MTRLVAGCMTGTSIDSIDAALVEITGRGLDMQAKFLRGHSAPLADLAPRLRGLADQHPMTAGDIAALSRDFSLAHIPVLRDLFKDTKPDLISIHGQTVFHRPPVSWQLLTPAVIAHEFKAPIVSDLRAADLAAGGQGAPITPIADWVLFRGHEDHRTVVNLGGFCNITRLFGFASCRTRGEDFALSGIEGADVCACNQLLDLIARERLGMPFDKDGIAASKGAVLPEVLTVLKQALNSQQSAHRSLGTGDELCTLLRSFELKSNDLARTAVEAIAETVCGVAKGTLILAGGGALNKTLVASLRAHASAPVTTTETFGVPLSHRESICFAILGALCQDRTPITLPQVTHVPAPAPISGSWVLP